MRVQSSRWWAEPRRTLLLFLVLAAFLVGAYYMKEPCTRHAWDGYQYSRMCYNDMQPAYGGRDLDEPGLPYVDHFNEYPVLVGMTEWLAARGSHDHASFWMMNVPFLVAAAIGAMLFLRAFPTSPYRSLAFAAAPSLIVVGYHNWDIYVVLFTAMGFWALHHGRPGLAGAAVALGASSKFVPGLFALPFLLYYAHTLGGMDRRRHLTWFLGGLAGVGLLVNGPFLLANAPGWWATFQFHADRTPNFETTWWVGYAQLQHWGWLGDGSWTAPRGVRWLALAIFLAAYAAVLTRGYRKRLRVERVTFEVLLLFLLTSTVFSVQYELWLLPFFVVLRIPWVQFGASEAAFLGVYASVFTFFRDSADVNTASFHWLSFFVMARAGVLGWMLVDSLVRGDRRDAEALAPSGAEPTAKEGSKAASESEPGRA